MVSICLPSIPFLLLLGNAIRPNLLILRKTDFAIHCDFYCCNFQTTNCVIFLIVVQNVDC